MESLITNNIAPMINSKQPVLDMNKAKESAESFEAFFLTRMMESMFEGVSTEGMFGGGHAEKIYRSLLLDEYFADAGISISGKNTKYIGGVLWKKIK